MKKLYTLLFSFIALNAFSQVTLNPSVYTICESPTDGYASFNLQEYLTNLMSAQYDPALYTINAYESMALVQANNPLPGVYTNTVAQHQVVYIKIWQNSNSNNTATSTLDLYVNLAATAYPITDIVLCDADGFNDGYTSIDLTTVIAEVLGPQSPPQFTVTYYTTQEGADAGYTSSADYISNPTSYTTGTGTVWIRVTNSASATECYDITSVAIQVMPLPEPYLNSAGNNHTLCIDYATGTILNICLVFKWCELKCRPLPKFLHA